MTTETNKAIVRRMVEAVNAGDLRTFEASIAPHFVDHGRPFLPPGRDALMAFFAQMGAAFSDMRITLDDLLAEGDKVVARGTITARHTGDFMGIPATNRTISFELIDINRFEDGLLAERWAVQDDLGLLQQLGAIPTA